MADNPKNIIKVDDVGFIGGGGRGGGVATGGVAAACGALHGATEDLVDPFPRAGLVRWTRQRRARNVYLVKRRGSSSRVGACVPCVGTSMLSASSSTT